MQWLKQFFSSGPFMPHSYCYLWNARLIWLHAISDALIALAYTSIPFTLIYFIRKRRDVPFNWIFACFGVFIVACGGTHVMEVITLWAPVYWFSGGVKVVTAVASVGTAILLVRIVPEALALPRPDEFRAANEALRRENREREKAEAEIRKLNEDLLRRAADLSVINKDLESFTYSVSHDLRAPLRHISAFSQILQEQLGAKTEPEAQEAAHRLAEAVLRMDRLLNDLLAVARVGQREIQPQVTGLRSLVDECLVELVEECRNRKIEWKIGDLPFVECDPGLMKQVFVNLLSNAVKYTRPRDRAIIEVGTADGLGQTTIVVRDNGVGFSMKYADQLFGVFQRLHRVEDFEGTGVGLAIAKKIIQKHGGEIWAEAELNRGAAFFFTLGAPPSAVASGYLRLPHSSEQPA